MTEEAMSGDDFYDEHDGGPPYASREGIDVNVLRNALWSLHLLGDDPFLRMQAFNLAIVDQFIMDVELEVLRKLIDEERTPVPEVAFLSAQSQMWIFAGYELLRTWRQRAKDMIKWHENGGLNHKLAAMEKEEDFQHFGRQYRAAQIRRVLDDQSLISAIQRDLRHTQILFVQLEAIRISLAKHEVRGRGGSVALRPGYGRINRWCGSLDYELENGRYSMGEVNRRDIADGIRALSTTDTLPTDEEIGSFEAFMRGPGELPSE